MKNDWPDFICSTSKNIYLFKPGQFKEIRIISERDFAHNEYNFPFKY